MTPERIKELRALVEAGTSGDRGNPLPWSVFERRRGPAGNLPSEILGADGGYVGTGDSDEIEALIVAAVNELAPLLDEVERLRGALEAALDAAHAADDWFATNAQLDTPKEWHGLMRSLARARAPRQALEGGQ